MNKIIGIPEECWPEIEELPGDLSRLAAIIESISPTKGVEATLAIVQEFRGTYIYCRNVDKLKRESRNRWIIKQYKQGLAVPKIAIKVGLGVRRVRAILSSETTGK